jgi:S1-C subfamily serine protease
MRKLCLILFAVWAAPQALGQQLKQSDLEKSVVQIGVVKQDKKFYGTGTGFFVREDGLIATALHVYSMSLQAITEGRGGAFAVQRSSRESKTFTVRGVVIVSVDPEHDLALLKFVTNTKDDQVAWDKVGGIKVLPICQAQEVESGSNAQTVGYFGSDAFPVTERAVLVGATVITTLGGDVDEFLVSASAAPGQSGSPVVLGDGSVLGVVLSIVPVTTPLNPQPLPSGLNRIAKAEFLQRLLSSLPK